MLSSVIKMKLWVGACAAVALLCFAAPASATTFLYNFNNPTGTLGISQAYTSNGVTVTAYGFNSSNVGVQLFGKNAGTDEVGVGINGTGSGDNEIQTNDYVQLDLTQLLAQNPTTLTMAIGSVQNGESWKLFDSATLGSLGTLFQSGTTDYPNTFTFNVSLLAGNKYLGVQAGGGDVLISSLQTNNIAVPEPATMVILGSSLAMSAFCKRRKAC